jgi:DNA-binding CsgD family transcriptional regulator
VLLRVLLHLGRAQDALAFYAELRQLISVEAWELHAPGVAVCFAHSGRLDKARATLRSFLGAHSLDADTAPNVLVQLLETSVLVQDREAAAALAAWLDGQASHATAGNDPTSIARHLGAAHALLGDRRAARASYETALETMSLIRFRPEVALTHLHFAELQLGEIDDARRTDGMEHLGFAIAELGDMHMQTALARAIALQVQVVGHDYPDRLTAREVDVLRRAANGRTNKEIAEDLVLSVRTVERHITNLYGKIGARGKADAATYALRHGLL